MVGLSASLYSPLALHAELTVYMKFPFVFSISGNGFFKSYRGTIRKYFPSKFSLFVLFIVLATEECGQD
jgi:hypothetical protein